MRMEDDPYFGKLPEELLGKIATVLPLQEGARTSILSRRWRSQWKSALLNSHHFVGISIIKFMPCGYPISCFETVDEFMIWADRVIRRREPFPPRPWFTTRQRFYKTEFSFNSLGLNFKPDEEEEDAHHGWVDFNNTRCKRRAPLLGGACTCCRSKVVSFLGSPQRTTISLSNLFSKARQELLKHLTLRNCDMEILRSQLTCKGQSFDSLKTLVVQKGQLIEGKFLSIFIHGCQSLNIVTLEDCSIVDNYGDYLDPCSGGRLYMRSLCLQFLRLIRCSGFTEVVHEYADKVVYDYPPSIRHQTVEFEFFNICYGGPRPIPQEEPELEPELIHETNALGLETEDGNEDESNEEEEADEVAYKYYDRFDRY